MQPKAAIGRAVRRERERAGLSLSALAKQADLAKSTLSQLEAGQGNPNIETLWSIATALDIPFSQLFAVSESRSKLIRADEGTVISASASDFAAVLLDPSSPTTQRDLYRTTIQKGEKRKAKPHPSGTIEHVIVCVGSVVVGPNGAVETLKVGDYYRYEADVPHVYEAPIEEAVLIIVMESVR